MTKKMLNLGRRVNGIAALALSASFVLGGIPSIHVMAAPSRRDEVVRIAEGELGNSNGSKYGSGPWCVYFARWCTQNAGVTCPSSGSTNAAIAWFRNNTVFHDRTMTSWSWNGYSGGGRDDKYIPRPGDWAAIDTDGIISNGPEHTGLVVEVSDDTIRTIEGNTTNSEGKGGYVWEKYYSLNTLSRAGSVSIVGFGVPDYGNDSYEEVNMAPVGSLDVVSSNSAGTIFISGWGYDPNDKTRSVEIIVCVGGAYGSAASVYSAGYTNYYRPDVNSDAYYGGCGDYTGFYTTVSVKEKGNQKVYVYAKDTKTGELALLDSAPKNVVIMEKQGQAPTGYDMNVNKTSVTRNGSIIIKITPKQNDIKKYVSIIYDENNKIYGEADVTDKIRNNGQMNLNIAGWKGSEIKLGFRIENDYGSYTGTPSNGGICTVQVVDLTATLNHTTVTMNKGDSLALSATLNNNNFGNWNHSWLSSDPSIVKVNDKTLLGLCGIKALKAGTCTITYNMTAETGDSCTAKCIVTVVDKSESAAEQDSVVESNKTGNFVKENDGDAAVDKKDNTGSTKEALDKTETENKNETKTDYVNSNSNSNSSIINNSNNTSNSNSNTNTEDGKDNNTDSINTGKENTLNVNNSNNSNNNSIKTDADVSHDTVIHNNDNNSKAVLGDSYGSEPYANMTSQNTKTENSLNSGIYGDQGGRDNYSEQNQYSAEPTPVVIGIEFELSGLNFRVTDDDEVAITGLSVLSPQLRIPGEVQYNGTEYTVTAIRKNAFKGNKILKEVVIEDEIEEIGDNAFAKCPNLETVVIGNDVEIIGKKAFMNCKKLNSLTIRTEDLDEVGKKAFSKISTSVVVTVPASMLSKYKTLLKKAKIPAEAKYTTK